mmetsp:Transcript_23661/g.36515  ORF Transcript_23661/g.36515 Transcript_23661/m.36515 type:complete len:573 (-) Transcript_23661:74-1792(-)
MRPRQNISGGPTRITHHPSPARTELSSLFLSPAALYLLDITMMMWAGCRNQTLKLATRQKNNWTRQVFASPHQHHNASSNNRGTEHDSARRTFRASSFNKYGKDKKENEWSPETKTRLLVAALGSTIVTVPYAVNFIKGRYKQVSDEETAANIPDIYNDIDFVDDEVMSGLSTRVILDYIFEKERDEEQENVLTKASNFLAEVIYNENTETALRTLVIKVLKSEEVLHELNVMLSKLFTDLVQDAKTLEQVTELLANVLAQEKIKSALHELVLNLIQDAVIFEKLIELVNRIVQDEEVKQTLTKILTNATHKTLSDDGIMQHTKEFAANLVGDSTIQRTGGDALWNTIGYSLAPNLQVAASLTLVGVISLMVGVFAWNKGNTVALPDDMLNHAPSLLNDESILKALTQPILNMIAAAASAPKYLWRVLVESLSNGVMYVTNTISESTKSCQSYLFTSSNRLAATSVEAINSGLSFAANHASVAAIALARWVVSSSKSSVMFISSNAIVLFDKAGDGLMFLYGYVMKHGTIVAQRHIQLSGEYWTAFCSFIVSSFRYPKSSGNGKSNIDTMPP